jgi:hypothetical protein
MNMNMKMERFKVKRELREGSRMKRLDLLANCTGGATGAVVYIVLHCY